MKTQKKSQLQLMISFIITLSFSGMIYGQFKIDGYSVNPKVGGFNSQKFTGGVAGVELNGFKSHTLYSIDYYAGDDISLFATPSECFNQVDFMIGKYIGDDYFRIQGQAGLGAVWGTTRGKQLYSEGLFGTVHYEKDPYFSLGIPVKLGFKVIPSRFVSLGIDVQGNANFENSLYMYMLSIEIGKLRDKKNKN
ncbi:MAG: hypothetical protein JXB49_11205 [Bacteroidales bacterium]|nr:hypothetical protein [Bacteroidales bacterium]